MTILWFHKFYYLVKVPCRYTGWGSCSLSRFCFFIQVFNGKQEQFSILWSIIFFCGILEVWGWLFGFNGSLRQYFSLYRAVSQREGERRETIDESKNVQTTPTRIHCKRNRPLPYCNQCCRTHRYWKFTQHHRTTQPPPGGLRDRFGRIYSIWDCTYLGVCDNILTCRFSSSTSLTSESSLSHIHDVTMISTHKQIQKGKFLKHK